MAEALCYPRPVDGRVPILVGGSGEQRTLRLVAKHADACNLFGEPDTVAAKVAVLHRHCADLDRDPSTIEVTSLTTATVDRPHIDRSSGRSPESEATALVLGTVDDHIGRFRAFADAGVQTAIISLPDLAHPGTLESFAPIIEAFR